MLNLSAKQLFVSKIQSKPFSYLDKFELVKFSITNNTMQVTLEMFFAANDRVLYQRNYTWDQGEMESAAANLWSGYDGHFEGINMQN